MASREEVLSALESNNIDQIKEYNCGLLKNIYDKIIKSRKNLFQLYKEGVLRRNVGAEIYFPSVLKEHKDLTYVALR